MDDDQIFLIPNAVLRRWYWNPRAVHLSLPVNSSQSTMNLIAFTVPATFKRCWHSGSSGTSMTVGESAISGSATMVGEEWKSGSHMTSLCMHNIKLFVRFADCSRSSWACRGISQHPSEDQICAIPQHGHKCCCAVLKAASWHPASSSSHQLLHYP
jgi:hypothetical protein